MASVHFQTEGFRSGLEAHRRHHREGTQGTPGTERRDADRGHRGEATGLDVVVGSEPFNSIHQSLEISTK